MVAWQGACVVVGGAWLWGACIVAGGMHGGSGTCMVAGGVACVGYDEIRSMSRRYASYWNPFLLKQKLETYLM